MNKNLKGLCELVLSFCCVMTANFLSEYDLHMHPTGIKGVSIELFIALFFVAFLYYVASGLYNLFSRR